ncbi:VPS4-associated protein 1 [Xylariales sp. PMI_506]|nr:VPS4-associated protein 1 [Xylariales sp. PMI_506]
MSLTNVWHHRKVAENSAKGCEICYKPSSSVLVTPGNQDYFYVCPIHLKDIRFCTPIIDEAAVAARKKALEDEEVERVKKEYEEKQRKKKEKEKEKEKAADSSKSDDKDKDGKSEEEKKKQDTTALKNEASTEPTTLKEEEPRVFALHQTFYQQRLSKKRQAEMAKRNRERLSNPNFFPSVPKGAP